MISAARRAEMIEREKYLGNPSVTGRNGKHVDDLLSDD
jgi:hypothetical protein